jgi:preprotein translocase subunit SecA
MKQQEEDGDYYIDEKTKTASLSSQGIQKLEQTLNVENLYRDLGYEEIHHIENALRAHAVYEKDKEYIVKDNEVLIVDEHTGRTMPGRRFSEGLHQAIEAKENVRIQRESKTLATITYQNFFKQYKKLAGMTGTALTEGEEFEKIYELSVLEVPTNKPTIRADKNDKVYFNQQAKRKFVRQYIEFAHEIGQPILIGTSNIATSEYVSKVLEKESITHYVLNAKFHEQEAHIVSQAGKYKSVVVATNMAGRGTDIKLENGLNNKLADNYAKWIRKTVIEN